MRRENLYERIVDLESALRLALHILWGFEPPDSRAVSDEFVAMAAVLANCANNESMQIIADGMEVERTYPEHAKVEVIEQ